MPGDNRSDGSETILAERNSAVDPAAPALAKPCPTMDDIANEQAPMAAVAASSRSAEPTKQQTSASKEKGRAAKTRKVAALQTAPKRLGVTTEGKPLKREWFARIRIREDRLARLWVSNLASHDVVVWSNKEKRWVALLAVAELRRALENAERELSRTRHSGHSSGSPSVPVRLPGSLPPAPPLAMLHSAAAGVGELRLRSIAQNPAVLTIGVGTTNESRRTASSPHLRHLTRDRGLPTRRAQHRPFLAPGMDSPPTHRSRRWHWRAMERVLWIASGVLAMFVLSGSGSAGERAPTPEPPLVYLTADQYDSSFAASVQSGLGPSLGQLLLGPRLECPIRPAYCQPPPNSGESTESELRSEDLAAREALQPGRPRLQPDAPSRTQAVSSNRAAAEDHAAQPDVPADLNFQAVRAALFTAAAVARTCRGESIGGRVLVTFEPAGTVRNVDIPLLIGDHPDRECIVRSFRNVRVPAFNGHAVAVKKDF